MSEEMSELHQLDEKYILKLEAKIAELEAASEFDHKEYLRLRNEQKARVAELEILLADMSHYTNHIGECNPAFHGMCTCGVETVESRWLSTKTGDK